MPCCYQTGILCTVYIKDAEIFHKKVVTKSLFLIPISLGFDCSLLDDVFVKGNYFCQPWPWSIYIK